MTTNSEQVDNQKFEPEGLEYLTPGLIRYYLNKGQIVVYQPLDSGKIVVDTWYSAVLEDVTNHPDDSLYLEIQDMRKVVPNTYNQKRSLDLIRQMSFREGRSATVISSSPAGRVIAYFVNHVFVPFSRNIKRHICFSLEEAFEWLLEEQENTGR